MGTLEERAVVTVQLVVLAPQQFELRLAFIGR
jgi:hypothetical protein